MSAADPDPKSVGFNFVKVYYQTLGKNPDSIHNLYVRDARFLRGDETVPAEQVNGQAQIQAFIRDMNIQNSRTEISQVDCQSSDAGMIVIQVIGWLSIRKEEARKFVQTFVLKSVAPNRYAVFNDIFRFLEDPEQKQAEEPQEAIQAVPDSSTSKGVEESEAIAPVEVEEVAPPAPEVKETKPQKVEASEAKPEPTPQVAEPEKPAAPLSYAERAARAAANRGPPAAANTASNASKPVNKSSQPKPQPQGEKPAPVAKVDEEQPSQTSKPAKETSSGSQRKQGILDKKGIYIPNLTDETIEDDIRSVFGELGNIVKLSVRRTNFAETRKYPKFAFLSFDNEEAAQKALQAAAGTFVIHGLALTIEERRDKPAFNASGRGNKSQGRSQARGERGAKGGNVEQR